MRENFSDKTPGAAISAQHINRINSVCRRVSRMSAGQYAKAIQTNDFMGVFPSRPWTQYRMLIHSELDRKARIYRAKVRYYDKSGEQTIPASAVPDVWKSINDGDTDWDLDALNIGEGYGPRLWPGDTIPSYWDSQRGMFVAISVPLQRKAVLNVAIAANTYGAATFYINQASTSWVENVWLNWLYTSDGLDSGQRVWVQWMHDEIDETQTTVSGNSVKGKWCILVPWC